MAQEGLGSLPVVERVSVTGYTNVTQCGGSGLDSTTDHPGTAASRPHSTATSRISDARADDSPTDPYQPIRL
jgi:hypothetical protein